MTDYAITPDIDVQASANRQAGVGAGKGLSTHYKPEARDAAGNLKWVEEFDNLVVTAGLNDSLDKHFKGSTYTAAWYVGITGATPSFAAGDTMSSHGGWTEVTAYDEANRPTLTLGTVSAGSVDNSASKARFTVSANGTAIGGAFVTTNNTKGGSTGTLYGGGAFSAGNKTLDAFGMACMQCWKSSARAAKGGGAASTYTFVLDSGDASNKLTVIASTIPDRDWVLLKDIADA